MNVIIDGFYHEKFSGSENFGIKYSNGWTSAHTTFESAAMEIQNAVLEQAAAVGDAMSGQHDVALKISEEIRSHKA